MIVIFCFLMVPCVFLFICAIIYAVQDHIEEYRFNIRRSRRMSPVSEMKGIGEFMPHSMDFYKTEIVNRFNIMEIE